VLGITANVSQIDHFLHNSLMLVTALNPHIGYDNAAKAAKKAYDEGKTLKEACLELDLLSESEFAAWVQPATMTKPHD
jgi:fumarate hydratase class II